MLPCKKDKIISNTYSIILLWEFIYICIQIENKVYESLQLSLNSRYRWVVRCCMLLLFCCVCWFVFLTHLDLQVFLQVTCKRLKQDCDIIRFSRVETGLQGQYERQLKQIRGGTMAARSRPVAVGMDESGRVIPTAKH